MTDVASSRDQLLTSGRVTVAKLRAAIEPTGAWLYGFLVVSLVAGSTGGYLPTAHGWTAVVTLWLAAMALILRDRIQFGGLDALFLGGLVAFTGWVALSNLWTPSMTSTMHEVQRNLAYVGVVAAGLMLTSRRTVPHLLGGVLAAITLLSTYALGVRILPDRFGDFDSTSFGYRLATPITYWNGLGIFTVMGVLLAFGIATRGRGILTRGLAAAAIPLLAATMYFTFSRGAWAALAVGIAVAVAIDPHRLQLLAGGLVLAPFAAGAVWAAEQREGLTTVGATLAQATSDGHSLVPILGALAGASALVAVVFGLVERTARIPGPVRMSFAIALVALLAAGVGVLWTEHGSPPHLADRAWSSFQAPPKKGTADVSERLFQLSNNGRVDLWATSYEAFQADPLRGSGGGTFWQVWAASPNRTFTSQEGHSLYMETLGDLGLPGVMLLVVALVAPLVAGLRARNTLLSGPALGAYWAFLAHAGIDWDWELTGLGAVALLTGVALVRSTAGSAPLPRPLVRAVTVAAVIAVSVVALPGLAGEQAIRSASKAIGRSDSAAALADLNRAARWLPWSSQPDELRANVWISERKPALARAAYRLAVEKDRTSWLLWSALASISTGPERERALADVQRLNPPR